MIKHLNSLRFTFTLTTKGLYTMYIPEYLNVDSQVKRKGQILCPFFLSLFSDPDPSVC